MVDSVERSRGEERVVDSRNIVEAECAEIKNSRLDIMGDGLKPGRRKRMLFYSKKNAALSVKIPQ